MQITEMNNEKYNTPESTDSKRMKREYCKQMYTSD